VIINNPTQPPLNRGGVYFLKQKSPPVKGDLGGFIKNFAVGRGLFFVLLYK